MISAPATPLPHPSLSISTIINIIMLPATICFCVANRQPHLPRPEILTQVSLPAFDDPPTAPRTKYCTAVAIQAKLSKATDIWRPAADVDPGGAELRGLLLRPVADWTGKLGFPPETSAFSLHGAMRSARHWGGAASSAGRAELAGGVERLRQLARDVRQLGPGMLTGRRSGNGAPWAPLNRGAGGAPVMRPLPGGVIHRRR
jgi:hypothetical protein